MADKKMALITGANKGLGKEIARQLGALGYIVLLGARDEQRGGAAADELTAQGIDARVVKLDVTDEASIQSAARQVESDFGGVLDVLINSAGISIDAFGSPASATELNTLRETYETNVFGVFAVTKHFLPLLKASTAGRIVNMSSGLGSLTENSDPDGQYTGIKPLAYNSSKAALNMVTVIFAAELKDTGIKVNAADPGYTATDLNQHTGPRTVTQGAAIAVHLATLPDDGPTGGYFNDNGVVPW